MIITSIDTRPGVDAYHPEQSTYTAIKLNPIEREVWVCQENDDNATPMDEYHDLILVLSTRRHPDEDEIRIYLTDNPLLETVCNGYERVWDGNNIVGRLSDEAKEAWYRIEQEIEELPETDWELWMIGDYFSHCSPSDWDLSAASTDEEIQKVADDLEQDALREYIILSGSVYKYLKNAVKEEE